MNTRDPLHSAEGMHETKSMQLGQEASKQMDTVLTV